MVGGIGRSGGREKLFVVAAVGGRLQAEGLQRRGRRLRVLLLHGQGLCMGRGMGVLSGVSRDGRNDGDVRAVGL